MSDTHPFSRPQKNTTAGIATSALGLAPPDYLLRINPDVPYTYALEQASLIIGCVSRLTVLGALDDDGSLVRAAHFLSSMAKALVDDVDVGMKPHDNP
ncbi:DUF3077 domain-containing protein [Pseudomonas capeferrum]|uniref:DUF3077 domain-containing protein n=1 Tax=Pseudomonas capeferrum TaxID=1495066 RepID=UPI0015E3B71D|nr:DUF3077 domain-containing protein [Pseudomonas capeferrum]MBA1201874.1 DUF3077 domain-containing protein [Pseudomonas capeferrum]